MNASGVYTPVLEMFDHFTEEELIDLLEKTDDEANAQFHTSIIMTAKDGKGISGDDLADMMKERNRTGQSIAKIARNYENIDVETWTTAGDGVPEIARRTPHKPR